MKTVSAGLLAGCLVAAVGSPLHAQDSRSAGATADARVPNLQKSDSVTIAQGTDEPGFVTKARRRLARLNDKGFYPDVDILVSGSGLSFGGSYRSPSLRSGLSVEVGTMWSVRGYREYGGQIGWLGHKRSSVLLRPAGAEIGSTLNPQARKRTGWAAFLDARAFNYRRLDYFGLNPDAPEPRSDFALSGSGIDAVVQWQPRADMGVSARIGHLELQPGAGTNDSRPNVEDVYTALTAPGIGASPRYRVTGIGAAWDRRDSPAISTRGVYLAGTLWRFSTLNDRAPSFTRATADVRAFYPVAGPNHVLAANVLASTDGTSGSTPIPFYLQSWLGGSKTLRGFSSYRLRGETLVHSAVEYRWRAARFIEVAPFFDMGAVSATGSSLTDGPLYTAAGAGLRVRTDDRVFVRLDWAYGDDGHRLLLALSPAF
jgi:hypothetical protein